MTEPKKYQALVEDKIFLGGATDVESMIQNKGVEVAIDLRGEAEKPAFSYPDVQWVWMMPLRIKFLFLLQAIDKVVNAYKTGKKVAFHYNGGRGRTGTVAAGTHLTLGLSNTLQEAEEKVKEIKPEINIKPEQKEVLNKLFSN
ncbi:protein-tyrosine phosphatase family protein [Brevibacillus nitrificans]|uniref:protein-tyrosine phosphatase family protein n=1 Tax=Brevibacillus nitrificans TaxID=651560 RepID=UPI001606C2CB|nr:protein tyrosine phosphatase [Brevibacillus nitrificans]